LSVGSGGTLDAWSNAPFPLTHLHLLSFDAGPGLVGTVAVLAEHPVRLALHV
jgi:hypothetical protein